MGVYLESMEWFEQETKDDGRLLIFGLRLPEEQEAEILRLNGELKKQSELAYILDKKQNVPYVRLYEAVFPERNIAEVRERTMRVAATIPEFSFKWGELEETMEVVILWGEVNDELGLLQERMLYQLNPLREGYFKQKYLKADLDEIQKTSLERWGWPWVEEYNPYVIVGKAKVEFDLNKLELVWDFGHCSCDRLVVAEKAGLGSLKNIQEWELVKV